jgi:hypothetical protein
MSKIDNGGPAFPLAHLTSTKDGPAMLVHRGITLREYAAIKLRVPDSGTVWLDEMISKSLRDDVAAKVMQGMYNDGTVAKASKLVDDSKNMDAVSQWAYAQADAMLRAREVKQ